MVDYNRIGDAGAAALAEALHTNASLTNLDLRGNDVSAVGAEALAEMLRMNATLTSLDLGFNSTGADLENFVETETGVAALIEALRANTPRWST